MPDVCRLKPIWCFDESIECCCKRDLFVCYTKTCNFKFQYRLQLNGHDDSMSEAAAVPVTDGYDEFQSTDGAHFLQQTG